MKGINVLRCVSCFLNLTREGLLFCLCIELHGPSIPSWDAAIPAYFGTSSVSPAYGKERIVRTICCGDCFGLSFPELPNLRGRRTASDTPDSQQEIDLGNTIAMLLTRNATLGLLNDARLAWETLD
jgi:hypothetical protein